MTIFVAYTFKDRAFNVIKKVAKNCSSIEDFEKDTLWNTVVLLQQNRIIV